MSNQSHLPHQNTERKITMHYERKVSSTGQVAIPKHYRMELELGKGTVVTFRLEGKKLIITKK